MTTADKVKNAVKEIQNHYNVNINNKYVKNVLLRMEVPPHVMQNKDFLLKGDLYYIDSRGAVEDLYMGIAAVMDYIDLIVKFVLPQVSINGAQYSAGSNDEKIMAQMAVKNYPMNVEVFKEKVCEFFSILEDYDLSLFGTNPAKSRIRNYDNLKMRCTQNDGDSINLE